MVYAFRFECYDVVDNPNLDKWDRKIRIITVTVAAETEDEAITKVSSLLERENYELDRITELSTLRLTD